MPGTERCAYKGLGMAMVIAWPGHGTCKSGIMSMSTRVSHRIPELRSLLALTLGVHVGCEDSPTRHEPEAMMGQGITPEPFLQDGSRQTGPSGSRTMGSLVPTEHISRCPPRQQLCLHRSSSKIVWGAIAGCVPSEPLL